LNLRAPLRLPLPFTAADGTGRKVKPQLAFASLIVIAYLPMAGCGQTSRQTSVQTFGCSDEDAKKTVETLWSMASRADLLTSDGWNRASNYFSKPGLPPGNKVVQIMSDYYGVHSYSGYGKLLWLI
jgi:hypothetical protein